MKLEQTECSETSAYKIQLSGNHPKERTQAYDTFINENRVELTFRHRAS